jgi:hypothetical protein
MWFKTQAGLVNIEGTAQYLAFRWKRKEGSGTIWFAAYQNQESEFEIKRLFRKPIKARGRYIYLAAFVDNDHAERSLADCMRKIESSIRNDEIICDLSSVGERSLWQKSERGVPVNWNA